MKTNSLSKLSLAMAAAGCLVWMPVVAAEGKKADTVAEALSEGDTAVGCDLAAKNIEHRRARAGIDL